MEFVVIWKISSRAMKLWLLWGISHDYMHKLN